MRRFQGARIKQAFSSGCRTRLLAQLHERSPKLLQLRGQLLEMFVLVRHKSVKKRLLPFPGNRNQAWRDLDLKKFPSHSKSETIPIAEINNEIVSERGQ